MKCKKPENWIANASGESNELWMSKIFFTSRTHSQLKQAMKELKSSNFRQMPSAILGSRSHMCINNEVLESQGHIHSICRSTVKRRECKFHNKYEELKSDTDFIKKISCDVMDIEDLVSMGREKQFCPYFMSQYMAEKADIVFSPYNYILDERIRCKNEMLMEGLMRSVIVFDEAHNIPQICENYGSIEFGADEISTALNDVEDVKDLVCTRTANSAFSHFISNARARHDLFHFSATTRSRTLNGFKIW